MPLIYHVYTLYIQCIYLVYTLRIHADIACTCCSQGFVALIAQTRRPLMAQRTTCQINTMRLILISLIHNQCWKHWSTVTQSNFCRHASYLTGRETTSTPSRLLSSSQTCIAGLCAPVVTHSIWRTIDFGKEMSRYIHIHGICCVYNMYMSVLYHVYVCILHGIYMDLPIPAQWSVLFCGQSNQSPYIFLCFCRTR